MDAQERATHLGKVPLFSALAPNGLELVAAVAAEERYASGERIFSHGDDGDRLYVVVSGKVRISRTIAGVGDEALAMLKAGALFGEMALIDGSPRSADAWAQEECRLLAIRKEAFEDLLFLQKELAYEVLWNMVKILSTRLRQTTDKLTFLTSTDKFS